MLLFKEQFIERP